MANSSLMIFTASLLISVAALSPPSAVAGADMFQIDEKWSWMPVRPACKGTIAECMADGEFEMGSEIHRRLLQSSTGTKYVSYGALQRNSVPCSQRGTSYYNCKQGGEANPYSRGCSAISRCRS